MAVSKETLEIFRSVRTSDVTDALDSLGLQQRYEMDPAMRPLYPGIRLRRHRPHRRVRPPRQAASRR